MLDETYVHENFEDAAASIELAPRVDQGEFTQDPYTIDALIHLAGFLLNGALDKPWDDVHVANSVGSFRLFTSLMDKRQCTVYASIRERPSLDVSFCGVYVFNENELIAACTDIRFHKLTRDVISSLDRTRDSIAEGETADGAAPEKQGTANQEQSVSKRSHRPSHLLLQGLAAELRIGLSDLEDTTDFASLGLNSMLSIKILSSFKKHSGVELPAGFFVTHPTVAAIREAVDNSDCDSKPFAAHSSQQMYLASASNMSAFKDKVQADFFFGVNSSSSPMLTSSSSTPLSNPTPSPASGSSSRPPSRAPQVTREPAPHEESAAESKNLNTQAVCSTKDAPATSISASPTQPLPNVSELDAGAILIQIKAPSVDAPLFLAPADMGMVVRSDQINLSVTFGIIVLILASPFVWLSSLLTCLLLRRLHTSIFRPCLTGDTYML